MSFLKTALMKVTGNKFSQELLEKIVFIAQYFMGIGSGSSVDSSGEQVIFDVLANKCRQPFCLFDIGANKGQFLELVVENLSSYDFTAHCFEPGAETFQILKKNFKKDNRIILNNLGLGGEKSEKILYYDSPGSGIASLTKRRLDHINVNFDKSEKVEIDTVDNYCRDNDIRKINLMKIDVEGHELDVLGGASHMFEQGLVEVVTFEFGGCNIDTRSFFQDFYYFFHEVNMSLFRITPSGYLYPVNSYKEIFEQFRTTNFLAVANR